MFAFEISSAWQATHPRVSLISLYTTAYHSATLEVPLLEVRFISKRVELGEFSSETNKSSCQCSFSTSSRVHPSSPAVQQMFWLYGQR